MTVFWLGQIIGIIAVIVSISVYQFNNRVRMLQLAMISALLFAASFYCLKAYTAAALNVLGAIRCYVYFKVVPGKRTVWIFWLFALLSIIAAAITWGGPVSLLALAGTLLYGIAEWQKSPKIIRRFSMLGPPLWFCYNFIVRSYPGMVIEIFVMFSNVVGQFRFDKKYSIRFR
jgi:hypothetical protein